MKWYPQQNALVGRARMLLNSVVRPGFSLESTKVFTRYSLSKSFPVFNDNTHLEETMQWLSRAHNATKRMGVSASYALGKGWDVAYPETSGYIIGTFCSYAAVTGHTIYNRRAVEIGDWEIDLQTPDGGILSNPTLKQRRVFNTGQVILGWCQLFELTQNEKYLSAAKKAGDYLVKGQEIDGSWIQDTHCGARTYHARVAWALIRLHNLSKVGAYLQAALKNIQWVLNQQRSSGWFDKCGFFDYAPITHVIVYTLRGLFECHVAHEAVHELSIPDRLRPAVDSLVGIVNQFPGVFDVKGLIPASFDESWKSLDNHSCLTGNAQLSYFLYRFYQITKNEDYRLAADLLCEALKRTQVINTPILEIRGAVAGSFPFWKGYAMNTYPNWAAKFFADALMMKSQFKNGFSVAA